MRGNTGSFWRLPVDEQRKRIRAELHRLAVAYCDGAGPSTYVWDVRRHRELPSAISCVKIFAVGDWPELLAVVGLSYLPLPRGRRYTKPDEDTVLAAIDRDLEREHDEQEQLKKEELGRGLPVLRTWEECVAGRIEIHYLLR